MQSLKLALYCLAGLCLALVACEDIDKASAPAEKPEDTAQAPDAAEANVADATAKDVAPAEPTTDSPDGENKPAVAGAPQLGVTAQPGALKVDSSAFKLGAGVIKLDGDIKAPGSANTKKAAE